MTASAMQRLCLSKCWYNCGPRVSNAISQSTHETSVSVQNVDPLANSMHLEINRSTILGFLRLPSTNTVLSGGGYCCMIRINRVSAQLRRVNRCSSLRHFSYFNPHAKYSDVGSISYDLVRFADDRDIPFFVPGGLYTGVSNNNIAVSIRFTSTLLTASLQNKISLSNASTCNLSVSSCFDCIQIIYNHGAGPSHCRTVYSMVYDTIRCGCVCVCDRVFFLSFCLKYNFF